MAETFKFYADAALTTELTQVLADSISHEFPVYFGSVAADKQVQASSDPGVDQITVTPADANPGTGHEVAEVKFALLQGDLDAATAGAGVNLGVTIASGVGNAAVFWVRLTDATSAAPGVDNDLSFDLNSIDETSTA